MIAFDRTIIDRSLFLSNGAPILIALGIPDLDAQDMQREEKELRAKHPAGFETYAASVPLFFPVFRGKAPAESSPGAFSWARYKKNHEYEAAFGFVLLLIALAIIWRLRTA